MLTLRNLLMLIVPILAIAAPRADAQNAPTLAEGQGSAPPASQQAPSNTSAYPGQQNNNSVTGQFQYTVQVPITSTVSEEYCDYEWRDGFRWDAARCVNVPERYQVPVRKTRLKQVTNYHNETRCAQLVISLDDLRFKPTCTNCSVPQPCADPNNAAQHQALPPGAATASHQPAVEQRVDRVARRPESRLVSLPPRPAVSYEPQLRAKTQDWNIAPSP